MITNLPRVQKGTVQIQLGVISTGSFSRGVLPLGKLVQWVSQRRTFAATRHSACRQPSPIKRSFGSDGPPGAYADWNRDVIFLIGANIADNHPILFQRLEANPARR